MCPMENIPGRSRSCAFNMMVDINWMSSKEIAFIFTFLTMDKNACFYTPLATQRVKKPTTTKTFSSFLSRLLVTSVLPLNRFLKRSCSKCTLLEI